MAQQRLVIVSNRLPLVVKKNENGERYIEPGQGGLVTAMAPVLRDRGGLWIGWTGTVSENPSDIDDLIATANLDTGYDLKAVHLTQEDVDLFYYGFANEIIWPLFHDLQSQTNFRPEYWRAYQDVNAKFAKTIADSIQENDFVWIHDYHLMSAAKHLRTRGMNIRLGFFLHIPFPPLDIFMKLPWRFQVLRDILEYDLIGFQTPRDRRNFEQCVRALLPSVRVRGTGSLHSCKVEGRDVQLGCFAISIDYDEFADMAASDDVSKGAWYIHEDLSGQHIVLGVDRLDYTKGIPNRLEAYRTLLQKYPELHEKVTLIQVVVPSRTNIPMYAALKEQLDGLVGEINGTFTKSGWVPIHYIFRSLNRTELLSYYRTAETALITPLKDGMNLVAKEYCACAIEQNGTLILSEFAGAASEFYKYALMVNPYDIEGVADALYQAYSMDSIERRYRMRRLRHIVRKNDIFHWVESFLQAAFTKKLVDFPVVEDYYPAIADEPEKNL